MNQSEEVVFVGGPADHKVIGVEGGMDELVIPVYVSVSYFVQSANVQVPVCVRYRRKPGTKFFYPEET